MCLSVPQICGKIEDIKNCSLLQDVSSVIVMSTFSILESLNYFFMFKTLSHRFSRSVCELMSRLEAATRKQCLERSVTVGIYFCLATENKS